MLGSSPVSFHVHFPHLLPGVGVQPGLMASRWACVRTRWCFGGSHWVLDNKDFTLKGHMLALSRLP